MAVQSAVFGHIGGLRRHFAIVRVRFEEVITHAIEGLGMDPDGRRLLQDLAGNLDVTSRSCLLWRVVAQNQDEAREELKQTLSEADQQRTWSCRRPVPVGVCLSRRARR